MDCARYQEAISARIDGETLGMPESLLASHLDHCEPCRAWEAAALAATRAARMRTAEPVPDLSGAIVTAITADGTHTPLRPVRTPAEVPGVIRLTLGLVAAAQLFIAVPPLVGHDLGATVHVAHEQGAWALALAAGLAFAALKPSRAAALLPLLGVFVAAVATLTLTDIAAGRVAPSAELPHLMAAVGLSLLWLEVHPPVALLATTRTSPPPPHDRLAA